MAGLSGFSYYKTITISNANVTADVANFPIYVPIVNDTDIGGHANGTNGFDVQFSNSDNSAVLSFERIYWNNPAGTANGDFYVLVPLVTTAAATVIRCYYGKAGESDLSAPTTVFNKDTNNWVAVWHLEESGSGYLDATANNNDSNAQTAPTRATGRAGYGQDFTRASSHYIRVATSTSLDIGTSDFTVSWWLNKHDTTDDAVISKMDGNGWSQFQGASGSGYKSTCDIYDPDDSYCESIEVSLNVWHHIAFSCDRDNASGFIPYADGIAGTATDPTASVSTLASGEPLYLGCHYGASYFLDGVLDEVRVSNTVRSAAWIKLEAKNMEEGHAAGNELTWGGELSGGEVSTVSIIVGEE